MSWVQNSISADTYHLDSSNPTNMECSGHTNQCPKCQPVPMRTKRLIWFGSSSDRKKFYFEIRFPQRQCQLSADGWFAHTTFHRFHQNHMLHAIHFNQFCPNLLRFCRPKSNVGLFNSNRMCTMTINDMSMSCVCDAMTADTWLCWAIWWPLCGTKIAEWVDYIFHLFLLSFIRRTDTQRLSSSAILAARMINNRCELIIESNIVSMRWRIDVMILDTWHTICLYVGLSRHLLISANCAREMLSALLDKKTAKTICRSVDWINCIWKSREREKETGLGFPYVIIIIHWPSK